MGGRDGGEGVMATDSQYIPILKAKASELRALGDHFTRLQGNPLEEYDPQAPLEFQPLFELVDVPTDPTTDSFKYTPEEYIDLAISRRIGRHWPPCQPYFLDTSFVAATHHQLPNNQHFVQAAFAAARHCGIPVPVVNTWNWANTIGPSPAAQAYAASLSEVIEQGDVGCCIRLSSRIVNEAEDDQIIALMGRLLTALSVDPDEVDLIIDCGCIDPADGVRVLARTCRDVISALQTGGADDINAYRSVHTAASSFPRYNRSFNEGLNRITRPEWYGWLNLRVDRRVRRVRTPGYGDYGPDNPQHPDAGFDPRYMTSYAVVRYTTGSGYLVARGSRERNNQQYESLTRQIAGDHDFEGEDFSDGDRRIYEASQGPGHGEQGHGDAGMWRRAGVNHHLALVLDDLASLGGS